jgi:predicted DNA-binding transcriptional regulator AlpA
MTPVDPLCLSAADVGRLLGISTRQVWNWDASGALGPAPTKMSERITRWDRSEIESWWAACRREGRRIGRREWRAMIGSNSRITP